MANGIPQFAQIGNPGCHDGPPDRRGTGCGGGDSRERVEQDVIAAADISSERKAALSGVQGEAATAIRTTAPTRRSIRVSRASPPVLAQLPLVHSAPR
jgi:hypothetical protein